MMRSLALSLLLTLPLYAAPVDPVLAKTKSRIAELNKIPSATNAYSQLQKSMLSEKPPILAEVKPLAQYLSLWPDAKTTLQKIKESKTFATDLAKFEKAAKRVGPALQLPYFYARPNLEQYIVPNWLGLRSYCMAQNVQGIYLVSQGKDGLELLGNSLVSAARISGNGPLIQQMIALNLNNGGCDSLFQVLQSRPKLPLASLQKLQQRLQKFPLQKSAMADSLDIEELWLFTRFQEFEPALMAKYVAFHAKWRPKVVALEPVSGWHALYLKERDTVAQSNYFLSEIGQIDYGIVTDFWREGLERRQLLDCMLGLEIARLQKGSYPTSIKPLANTTYKSDGKSYTLVNTSPAWDTKGKGTDRKPTPRTFQG
jgi:hypothetical protein